MATVANVPGLDRDRLCAVAEALGRFALEHCNESSVEGLFVRRPHSRRMACMRSFTQFFEYESLLQIEAAWSRWHGCDDLIILKTHEGHDMKYSYKLQQGLSPAELFFWIVVDKTLQQLGGSDVATAFAIVAGQPIIPTRAKVGGATRGTSIASVVSRRILNIDLKMRLPMITGSSIRGLRIALTKNLGAFVGRSVPVVGWVIVANDVVQIFFKSVLTYNSMVSPEDRLVS